MTAVHPGHRRGPVGPDRVGGAAQQRQDHPVQHSDRRSTKTANYPGVTVERKSGRLRTPVGRTVELLDLPGSYSRARAVRRGHHSRCRVGSAGAGGVAGCRGLRDRCHQSEPASAVAVGIAAIGSTVDSGAQYDGHRAKRGCQISLEALSRHLGIPVVTTVAMRKNGCKTC